MGSSISFNAAGTRLAIGACAGPGIPGPGTIDISYNTAVYIYDYDVSLNEWSDTYTQKYTIPEPTGAVTQFGCSVSLNAAGDRLAIGAPNYWTNSPNQGAFFIYHQVNGQWPATPTQQYWGDWQTVGVPNDQLGYNLIFNAKGDRIAVCAKQSGTNKGRVYLFHYN